MACSVTAALPYHPYRKVGERYYSLLPIYTWERLRQNPSKNLTQQQREELDKRPMPEWIGFRAIRNSSVRVARVLKDALVIERRVTTLGISGRFCSTLVLKNYPEQTKVVDELYDYGIPYDPFEKQRTNAPAKVVRSS